MSVYVVVCVFIILAVRQHCVGVCMSVYVCVGVLIWCRLGTNEEACFVCHCVCDFDSLLVHPGAVVTC